jgi:2,4-dienoyl-CoA reductase-like NADH-dependent reductase (Old Yellow Enzyme family)
MTTKEITPKAFKFKLKTLDVLKEQIATYAPSLTVTEDLSPLTQPVTIGEVTAPNAMAIHPMEGCDGHHDGCPSELTLRRYQRFAAGGAGLLWVEACAVVPEGRANPRQIWMHEDNFDQFKSMVDMIRKEARESMGPDHNPVLVLQLTHSGRYSKPKGVAAPLIGQYDPYRDPLTPEKIPSTDRTSNLPDDLTPVTDEYLDQLQGHYVKAAKLAYAAGFDIVDIKSCHGYLINELLACRQRAGKYGGSFENRTRFLLDIVDRIKTELGVDGSRIATRLGFYDAIPFPYGWAIDEDDYRKENLDEPKKLVQALYERGVRVINFTAGNPYYNPHVGRPFDKPIEEGYAEPEHPLVGIERLVNLASEMQQRFPEIAFIGTGYSWLRQYMGNVAAANLASGKIKIVGCGRMGFAHPNFAKEIIETNGIDKKKSCTACSGCTQMMRDQQVSGCMVRDIEIYVPIFKLGRSGVKATY